MKEDQKIYVISCEDLPDDKRADELSNEEFMELADLGGWSYDSVEEMIAEINSDGQAPYPSYHYLRII